MDTVQNYLKYEPIDFFKNQLKSESDPHKVQSDYFSHRLNFGTAGLRGLMKPGLDGINGFTIGCATKALASYLKQLNPHKKLLVCISYDNRHHSMQFAEIAARVLAHEGIHVKLAKTLRPTPWLSFAIKQTQADAGIMITASHNPPSYNGYKVYLSDGGQIVAPHDKNIMKLMENTHSFDLSMVHSDFIELIDTNIDHLYLDMLKHHITKEHQSDLEIVYTPLCGTGGMLIPEALKEIGFHKLTLVETQAHPDPNFAGLLTPNPETLLAMQKALDLLEKTKADIAMATDPDADRIGIAVRHGSSIIRFNGHEIALILLDYLIHAAPHLHEAIVVSSFVTTHLLEKMCKAHGIAHKRVLTGFKYIGQVIEDLESRHEESRFLLGAEESYGYLVGTHAKDKDAIIISALLAKAAQKCKQNHTTLYDRLLEIYKQYGLSVEESYTLELDPSTTPTKIGEKLEKIIASPPDELFGDKAIQITDFKNMVCVDLNTKSKSQSSLPATVALGISSKNGWLIVRPSGTEPKLKIYGGLFANPEKNIEQQKQKLHTSLQDYLAQFAKDHL